MSGLDLSVLFFVGVGLFDKLYEQCHRMLQLTMRETGWQTTRHRSVFKLVYFYLLIRRCSLLDYTSSCAAII